MVPQISKKVLRNERDEPRISTLERCENISICFERCESVGRDISLTSATFPTCLNRAGGVPGRPSFETGCQCLDGTRGIVRGFGVKGDQMFQCKINRISVGEQRHQPPLSPRIIQEEGFLYVRFSRGGLGSPGS